MNTKTCLAILLVFLSISGCATGNRINLEGLGARKERTFIIGVVKVTGRTPFTDKIESKTAALQDLDIERIAAVISAKYGIRIDPKVDRTIRTFVDPGNQYGGKLSSRNPYLGNLTYKKKTGFLLSTEYSLNDNTGDIVNIEYRIEDPGFMQFNFKLTYHITVKSDGLTLIDIVGDVASVPMKPLDYSTPNLWDALITNAGVVDDKLSKDLLEVARQ